MSFRPGQGIPVYPNLQLWDYASRILAGKASTAARAGNNQEAARFGGLSRLLKGELDNIVPEFGQARGTAAQFFGGENALDAGSKAVNYRGPIITLRQQLNGMKPAEREMFQEAYADTLASRVEATADRTDLTNKLFSSPQERAKIDAIFGDQGTRAFEAFLRRENIFDSARKAVSGNSTTARQLIELGLSHGAKALGTGAAGSLIGGFFNGPQGMLEGFGLGAAGKIGMPLARAAGERAVGVIDKNVARHVAELLTSSDPAQLQKGLRMVASNQKIANGLRAIEQRLATVAGSQAARSTNALDRFRPTGDAPLDFSQMDQDPKRWGAVPVGTTASRQQ